MLMREFWHAAAAAAVELWRNKVLEMASGSHSRFLVGIGSTDVPPLRCGRAAAGGRRRLVCTQKIRPRPRGGTFREDRRRRWPRWLVTQGCQGEAGRGERRQGPGICGRRPSRRVEQRE